MGRCDAVSSLCRRDDPQSRPANHSVWLTGVFYRPRRPLVGPSSVPAGSGDRVSVGRPSRQRVARHRYRDANSRHFSSMVVRDLSIQLDNGTRLAWVIEIAQRGA